MRPAHVAGPCLSIHFTAFFHFWGFRCVKILTIHKFNIDYFCLIIVCLLLEL